MHRLLLIVFSMIFAGFISHAFADTTTGDNNTTSNTSTTSSNNQNNQSGLSSQNMQKETQKAIKALTKSNYKKWSGQQNFDSGFDQEEGKLFGNDQDAFDNAGDD